MARGEHSVGIQPNAVQDVRGNLESAAVRAFQKLRPEGLETDRVVELVAVDTEDPGVRAGVGLDQTMRLARMVDAACLEMVVFALQPAQDLPRSVRRDVIGRVDAVAESRDVPDRPLDEEILVANEDDADDARR